MDPLEAGRTRMKLSPNFVQPWTSHKNPWVDLRLNHPLPLGQILLFSKLHSLSTFSSLNLCKNQLNSVGDENFIHDMLPVVNLDLVGSRDSASQLILFDDWGRDVSSKGVLDINPLAIDCGECDLNLQKLRETELKDFCTPLRICDSGDISFFSVESGWEVSFCMGAWHIGLFWLLFRCSFGRSGGGNQGSVLLDREKEVKSYGCGI